MDPYESIYAGEFVFMLGYLCAARGLVLDGNCVTLLAQNRGDEVIGDLVASWSGLTTVIEFKRRETDVRTEFRKRAKKYLLASLKDKDHSRWLEASRKGHFLAFGAVAGREADIRVLSYADIEDSPKQRAASMLISEFLDRILDGQIGFEPTTFRSYISALKTSHDAVARRRRAPETMSSLAINYNAAMKRFTFLVVDLLRVRELSLDPHAHRSRDFDLDL